MRSAILDLSPPASPGTGCLLGGLSFEPQGGGEDGLLAVPARQLAPAGQRAGALLVEGPVEQGSHGPVAYRTAGELLFGRLQVFEADFGEDRPERLMKATEAAYESLFECIAALGFETLARVWNYLPDINRESHGLERYRQFNAGRQLAFAACGRPLVGRVPAACALGTAAGPLSIAFLATRREFSQVENPRQVSAYHYPRDYGERSPTFSRAGVLHLAGGDMLFVSGTAAIVGHRSLHPGDVLAQTREAMANIGSVVAEAGQLPGATPRQPEALDYTIYLRRAADLESVRSLLADEYGLRERLLFVEADICRADLLVEIEACGGMR